jgi:hypothetical protein
MVAAASCGLHCMKLGHGEHTNSQSRDGNGEDLCCHIRRRFERGVKSRLRIVNENPRRIHHRYDAAFVIRGLKTLDAMKIGI